MSACLDWNKVKWKKICSSDMFSMIHHSKPCNKYWNVFCYMVQCWSILKHIATEECHKSWAWRAMAWHRMTASLEQLKLDWMKVVLMQLLIVSGFLSLDITHKNWDSTVKQLHIHDLLFWYFCLSVNLLFISWHLVSMRIFSVVNDTLYLNVKCHQISLIVQEKWQSAWWLQITSSCKGFVCVDLNLGHDLR